MWSYWWSIPGPRHFVAEIVASLRAGRQAVVLLPAHGPPGLAAAVASVVEQDDGWVWSRVPVTAGHHGADAIRHALLGGAAPGTLADLVAHPTLQGRVLWIEGLTADTWPAWAPFIRAFAAAAAARPILDRPLLVLCVTGLATAAWPDAHPNLSVCPWYDRLDDLDMQQWAVPIPPKVDSHSSANWTPDPPQTGRLFQVKLDSRSEATLGVDVIYVLWVTSVNVGLRGHR